MWSVEKVSQILDEVKDPEIPVLTIADLGIIREIKVEHSTIEVTITPTYSGCPATQVIQEDIRNTLNKHGIEAPVIKTSISPPWTTDWISEKGKVKLQAYGIAPPEESTSDKKSILGKQKEITCPRCKSKHTKMLSHFGSTPCKAQYQCEDCLEPFDYFKCI